MATGRLKINPKVLERIRARRASKEKFAEFIEWVQERPSTRFVFRGQEQKWSLKSSIGRSKKYKPEGELLLLQEFRRMALPYVSRSELVNDWDWLAVAQHHGLPTRLIDWTTNALVACYFASQPSSVRKREGQIVAINTTEIGYYTPDDPEEVEPSDIPEDRFIKPSALVNRIVNQKGLFSIHPMPNKAWQPRKYKEEFVIPAEMKNDFQRLLFSMGVDAAFLMADLDGLTNTLKWRFETGVLTE